MSTVVVMGTVWATSADGLSATIDTPWREAAVLWALVLVAGTNFRLQHRPPIGRNSALGRDQLLVSGALLSFFAITAGRSALHGTILWSALLVATAVTYGALLRVTTRTPFIPAITVLVGVVGAALAIGRDQAVIVGAATAFAVAGEIVMGEAVRGKDQSDASILSYQAAFYAQQALERRRELDRVADSLTAVVTEAHDMGSVLLALEGIINRLTRHIAGDAPVEDESELAELMTDADALVHEAKRMLRGTLLARPMTLDGELEPVDLSTGLTRVVDHVGRAWPDVTLKLEGDGADQVLFQGGREWFERVLRNLLLNACQGDGTRGADTVRVKTEPAGEHRLRLTVEDDGPGFPDDVLTLEAYASTKPDGTGLGLYTADRLVRASGGAMERWNRDEGGAVVSMFLRLPGPSEPDPA